jgi:photoactive yellow protein
VSEREREHEHGDETPPPGPTLAELGHHVENLDPDDLDSCPFGVIHLDARGHILHYNSYEERLANLKREDVVGKSFFFEVAPCTRVRTFYGRFLDGVARGALNATFGFVFPFRAGERRVEITLFSQDGTNVWVLVRG